MNRQVKQTRRGVSLTELLVLMSSYTMILSLCGVLLHRAMRVEIDSRSFVDSERTSERLGQQFRQDVHQATTAETDGARLANDAFLKLQLPDEKTVEYSRIKGNVLRIVSQSGKAGRREEFTFNPFCKLIVRQEESPKRIVLSLTSPALKSATDTAEQLQSYRAVPVGLYVEASLGRDANFMDSIAGKEHAK